VTEVHKDVTSSTIPKLLELNLEAAHKTWGDAVEDALKDDELRNIAAAAREPRNDRMREDARRYDMERNRMEGIRADDRPPAKKMKDEPSSYRNQRDDGYARDRADRGRGGRGRGKVDSYRSGGSRGARSSATDYRYVVPSRDSVVSEYQPIRGEKRGTLTFERRNLHPERQASFEGKHGGQFRSSESANRQGREGRGKERGENYGRKDDRAGSGKLAGAQSTSETVAGTFAATSNQEPVRTNAWSQPLHGSKQSMEPARSDEIPDITQWNASGQAPSDSAACQQESGADSDPLRKDLTGIGQDQSEIGSQFVESQGNDQQPGAKRAGSRIESSQLDYRSDRGRRQSRRGRRQNWPDQTELGENVSRYSRRSQPRGSRDGRSQRMGEDESEEVKETASREERSQTERRRTVRYGPGGRALYQSGYGEYSARSRGRGMFSCVSLCVYSQTFSLAGYGFISINNRLIQGKYSSPRPAKRW